MRVCPTIDGRGPSPETDAAELAWRHLGDGVALLDRGGVIVATNPSFDALVGFAEGRLIGRSFRDLLAPGDADRVVDAADSQSWIAVAGLECDGFPFVVDAAASSVAAERILVIVRPRGPTISRSADAADTHGTELAHALSHDVRGRLRSVSGFLDVVLEGDGADQPTDDSACLRRASAAARAGDRMLERLVHHVRLGEATFTLRPIGLLEMVRAASTIVDGDISVEAGTLPVVLAEERRMTECLVELFANAVVFARDGVPPVVSVTAEVSGGWCDVRISDNGRGMPADLVDDCFGLFRQLQARNWERGVGMGLPICRRIVDGHGGDIRIESDRAAGTTVRLRLALAPAPTWPDEPTIIG